MAIALLIILTISIIMNIIVLVWLVYHYINLYLDAHIRMGVYADIPTSLKNQAIYLDFVNVKRYPEFWNVHEDQLELYAMGSKINAVFYKSSDVPFGYKIAYSSTLSNMEILSMIESMQYSTFEVSVDGGVTRTHVNSIRNKAVEKIARKIEEQQLQLDEKNRKEILGKIIQSGKISDLDEIGESVRMIAHVNEGRTTGTTMRYQVIIPPSHEIIKNNMFDPETGKELSLYYVYEGHCYKLETKFIGRIDNLYEWDILNLRPGRIYSGLTFSFDGGKTLKPSSALYGITKDKHGELPTIDDSILAKPEDGEEKLKMWDEKTSIDHLGPNLTHKTYAIMVKKHFEDEYTEEYLALNRTHDYYDDYEWLQLSAETIESHIDKNTGKR